MRKSAAVCAMVALLATAANAHAQEAVRRPAAPATASIAGDYVHSEMELVAGIRLNPDGTFLYGLTVGALDETARGRWEAVGNHIVLTSDPRPVPPAIAFLRTEPAPGKPFAIRVLTPNGRDVPGVDLRIEFDTGAPLDSYLAGEPWSLPKEERRVPRFATFSMASYRLRPARMPLDARAGTIATFALTPNDFGVADLTGVEGEIDGAKLTLRRPEGSMTFERRAR